MLNFWYSERCARQIKLMFIMCTCVLIVLCSNIIKLDAIYVGICVALGITLHLSYGFSLRYTKVTGISYIRYVPVLALIIVMYYSIQTSMTDKAWALMVQGVGFMGIGLFLCSIYSNRAKRL
ncbi:hypothetical protein [Acinetobacter sp. NCu2D-2]|uniref:hypothetical protein n=1 Tax=Acinetobacter sp. NCu2D-2 TaxID=1608473 RepID=UPI0009D680E9|nr:hypothetical protein [Acinetobacter sp. NCu2D-2]